jgi:oligopeptide transport system substrate-binding protein
MFTKEDNMKNSLGGVLLALALILFVIVGCGPAADGGEEVVLNWNLGADPKTLDPGLNGATDGGDIIANTFEGLTRERNGVLYPGIAERWETSADGKTVTFYLRDSKWSDGSDLTAYDFEYAWKRAMVPETASEYSWLWEYTNVVGSVEATEDGSKVDAVGVTAVDDKTLVVELIAPTTLL